MSLDHPECNCMYTVAIWENPLVLQGLRIFDYTKSNVLAKNEPVKFGIYNRTANEDKGLHSINRTFAARAHTI